MSEDTYRAAPHSGREKALAAMASILGSMTGINYVGRQDIVPDLVSDAQMPAILIQEISTAYRYTRRTPERAAIFTSLLQLDLQCKAKRTSTVQEGDVSTIRELFAWEVMNALAKNARLNVQLSGEGAAVNHARDAALDFSAQYVPVPFPYARILLSVTMMGDEEFDDETACTEFDP